MGLDYKISSPFQGRVFLLWLLEIHALKRSRLASHSHVWSIKLVFIATVFGALSVSWLDFLEFYWAGYCIHLHIPLVRCQIQWGWEHWIAHHVSSTTSLKSNYVCRTLQHPAIQYQRLSSIATLEGYLLFPTVKPNWLPCWEQSRAGLGFTCYLELIIIPKELSWH